MTDRRAASDPLVPASPALALERVSKRFGSVDALVSASLSVRPGTVHALLGENGAGKSTLMRIAYGLVRADTGTIAVHGRAERFVGTRQAIARGIGMVHQHFTLVPVMTVAENIALGGRGLLDAAHVAERVREIARRTGFVLDPSATVETLPIGAQQRVEIAKALIRGARVLILDEPTAVLAPAETTELLRWIRNFADAGNAVVLITHKLQEALSVADDVTVLRLGRTVMTGSARTVTRESLTAAMLGVDRALPDDDESAMAAASSTSSFDRPVVYRADRVSVVDARGLARVSDATFSVRAGEIVGIAGVEGSGQHELLRVLAGRMQPSSGTLTRPARVGFIPEDRHRDAVLLERDLTENVALRGAGARHGIIDWRAYRADTAELMRVFDVRAEHPLTPMRTLSGGNQQKLVLARELRLDPGSAPQHGHAIVAENPTRGLDVRATLDVHARLRDACTEGAAIVLYSSDLDEVLHLATRVLVMYGGTVRETSLDRDEIGRAMLGLV